MNLGSGTENVTPSPSGLKRRDLLLSGGSLVAAAALGRQVPLASHRPKRKPSC